MGAIVAAQTTGAGDARAPDQFMTGSPQRSGWPRSSRCAARSPWRLIRRIATWTESSGKRRGVKAQDFLRPSGARRPRRARAASSRTGATAARRPPRSPGRPALPSRSSTAISTRSATLYIACLEEAWAGVRVLWEETVAAERDPGLWLAAMGRAFRESAEQAPLMSNLWVQAMAEASEDDEIRAYIIAPDRSARLRRRCDPSLSGRRRIPADRDADAEAWIFISLGLLSMADRSLGGVVEDRWLGITALAGAARREGHHRGRAQELERPGRAVKPASPLVKLIRQRDRRRGSRARPWDQMFGLIPGDDPETSALRPSRCLRVGVAGNLARHPHPSAWRPAGMRDGSDYSQSSQ